MSVLLTKEKNLYIAHCLEFDLVSQGDTKKEALISLIDCMVSHISFCLDKIENIKTPAPKKYWKQYNKKNKGI